MPSGSGSGCRQPASLLPAGDGPAHCWLALLWYLLSPLFCEQAQQYFRLELFVGKFSLSLSFLFCFFPSGYPTVCVSIWLPQIALRAFRPILTLSNAARTSLFSPCLLVADVSIWATSLLGVVVRHIICGFYLFFPPGYVAL